MAQEQRFVVARYPEWYSRSGGDHQEKYSCADTGGLLVSVKNMMLQQERSLADMGERYRPETLHRMIRDGVIARRTELCQKPSRSLLFALMDLVDVLGGTEFGSVATVDRAGLKHMLLTCENYTAYYIPVEEFKKRGPRPVIPVVTQYSHGHNLVRWDKLRSMIGTYVVDVQKAEGDKTRSYFVQEVLFAPGLESLKLLREIACSAFDFWDMALEMPTHVEALSPSFMQIQPEQLLSTEDAGSPRVAADERNERQIVASQLEVIRPLCCVPDEDSANVKKKREASVDCFGEKQVKCDLSSFHYTEDGGDRMVYFRRSGKVLEGKRSNLVPVVALGKGREEAKELYVSTTLRFYRALKRSCVRGNGQLMSCWKETLTEFGRETFIRGHEIVPEIVLPALHAFDKRVNLSGWCNSIPRCVWSDMPNPIMMEVLELAVTLMDNKIPSAFAVAELLYCDIRNVQSYLAFREKYALDRSSRAAVQTEHVALLEARIMTDRSRLADLVARYGKEEGCSEEIARRATECAESLRSQPYKDINKIQKEWFVFSKREGRKCPNHGTEKVLFNKVRLNHIKLKKLQRYGEHRQQPPETPRSSSRGGAVKIRNPPTEILPEPQLSNEEEKEEEEDDEDEREYDDEINLETNPNSDSEASDENERSDDGGDRNPNCDDKSDAVLTTSPVRARGKEASAPYVIPDPVPAAQWIENMTTLLLSEPWLNGQTERREAVCALLRLDETLLNKAHAGILQEWVVRNRPVVGILRERGLRDPLSAALVEQGNSLSTQRWAKNIAAAFPREIGALQSTTRAQPKGKPPTSNRRAAAFSLGPPKDGIGRLESNRRLIGVDEAGGGTRIRDSGPSRSGVPKPRVTRPPPSGRYRPTGSKSVRGLDKPRGAFGKPPNESKKHPRRRSAPMCLSEAEEASDEECEDDEDEPIGETETEDEQERELRRDPNARYESLALSEDRDARWSGVDDYDYDDDFIDDGPLESASSDDDEEEPCARKRMKPPPMGRRKRAVRDVYETKRRPSLKRAAYSDSGSDDARARGGMSYRRSRGLQPPGSDHSEYEERPLSFAQKSVGRSSAREHAAIGKVRRAQAVSSSQDRTRKRALSSESSESDDLGQEEPPSFSVRKRSKTQWSKKGRGRGTAEKILLRREGVLSSPRKSKDSWRDQTSLRNLSPAKAYGGREASRAVYSDSGSDDDGDPRVGDDTRPRSSGGRDADRRPTPPRGSGDEIKSSPPYSKPRSAVRSPGSSRGIGSFSPKIPNPIPLAEDRGEPSKQRTSPAGSIKRFSAENTLSVSEVSDDEEWRETRSAREAAERRDEGGYSEDEYRRDDLRKPSETHGPHGSGSDTEAKRRARDCKSGRKERGAEGSRKVKSEKPLSKDSKRIFGSSDSDEERHDAHSDSENVPPTGRCSDLGGDDEGGGDKGATDNAEDTEDTNVSDRDGESSSASESQYSEDEEDAEPRENNSYILSM